MVQRFNGELKRKVLSFTPEAGEMVLATIRGQTALH